ncbi:DMT family transporter [Brevibacillus daliensis]|uniref:DMT family transporter n=1 Tax=Brevibacillus daliensis TaxID=2892995 RepID=UPI001E5E5B54|nr:DMT family transporter [Brevibacillus daliensis]
MKSIQSNQWLGAVYLSLAAAIWGGLYVVSKVVLDVVPPFTLLVIRFGIAFLVLGIPVIVTRQFIPKKEIPLLILVGIVGVTISIGAQFVGTNLSSAHMGAVITSASPAFILLFAFWLLKERLTVLQVGGILLATLGVLLIIGLPHESLQPEAITGNLILLIAAVSWGLYTVLCKHLSASYSSLSITAYVALFGMISSSPLMIWELTTSPISWSFSLDIWAGILYIGVISTAGAFYLWNKGFQLVHAGKGAGFFFVQPIVGALLGWLLLGENLHLSFLIGSFIIFLGVALTTYQKVDAPPVLTLDRTE